MTEHYQGTDKAISEMCSSTCSMHICTIFTLLHLEYSETWFFKISVLELDSWNLVCNTANVNNAYDNFVHIFMNHYSLSWLLESPWNQNKEQEVFKVCLGS